MKKEKEKGKEEPKEKILIASPVRQTAGVLREYLQSLESLERTTVTTDYLFVNDNEEEAASNMLREFVLQHEGILIDADVKETDANQGKGIYNKDEGGHYWRDEQIWRVAGLKNRILAYARDHQYDAVFLIDSDLVLHPRTLEQLVSSGKEIVSNIFWTRWQPGTREMPQVWLQDEYALFRKRGNPVTGAEVEDENTQTDTFLRQLRTPGCYEVGDLARAPLFAGTFWRPGFPMTRFPTYLSGVKIVIFAFVLRHWASVYTWIPIFPPTISTDYRNCQG
ncbi:hypothetical protein [Paenibacillus sp. 1A_MP2]|uniref:hypothetical protein n=1 Tax=Paenibacillus sp. 1A_MP2 TaxID=3457495 RepID=UPI003FCED917